MTSQKLYLPIFLWLILAHVPTVPAEIISLAVGGSAVAALGAFFGGYTYTKCHFYECCNDRWIQDNITANLRHEVKTKLFGQHLAEEVVLKAVRAHINKDNPKKALVLSFHGWTGSGKNYLASMIGRSMFRKGMQSSFVHLFVATLHFPHPEEIATYQKQVRSWIIGNLTLCERSLFIFDEVDKLPIQMMDAVRPFIDYYETIGGVDPRRSVFLFLSNTGGNGIAQKALEYYESGRPREDITLKEMEEIVKASAYNEGEGGLKASELISRHMIDHFVPFLPLERRHVIMCVRSYLEGAKYDVSNDRIEQLADSLQYFPKSQPVFSVSGCKQIAQKADFLFADEFRHSADEI
ncbi:Torsin family protein [Aphelenchoides avenae]|nr:Torsin family protein [Aphelenchus avenae]KAH7725697.1 Torsin family protein [Aphelenchus avenae]